MLEVHLHPATLLTRVACNSSKARHISRGYPHQACIAIAFELPLFTPNMTGSSAELHPQRAPMDYISPMFLGYVDHPPENNRYASIPPSPYDDSPQVSRHPGSMSAPAHIAFNSKHVMSTDIDLDISPLTSPWLGAHSSSNSLAHRHSIKRTASPSVEEAQHLSRKRKSNGALAPKGASSLARRSPRVSRSTNSTPFLSAAPQDGGIQDSPSPVDLSMPPPVSDAPSMMPGPSSQSTTNSMTPVTPAMIMNLGRMTTNSSKPSNDQSNATQPPRRAEVSTRSKTTKKVAPEATPIQPGKLHDRSSQYSKLKASSSTLKLCT